MNKRSSGCPREKEENCRSVQDNPHIREVHLGAIRQDVSSAIRLLEWMMPRIVNKGGNTVKIVPNSLFGY